MFNGMDFGEFNLVPKYGFCDDVKLGDFPVRKIVWLVPRTIKHADSVELITWRCNWGHACKSACIYASAKDLVEEIPLRQDVFRKTDPTLIRE